MKLDALRAFCLSFPGAEEDLKWGADLTFCVGKKMFVITSAETAEVQGMSLKVTPEIFAELTEREGITPAAYLARYHWIAIRDLSSLSDKKLKELIKLSYELVYEKLPGKVRKTISA
jgi:predicted DNA-binding protein (MmcQ/YjbR family)